MHPIQRIVQRNRAGEHAGIYSCCSANEYVLRAALQKGKRHNIDVLIEATANQVDQNGGYTGMRPADFYAWAQRLALEEGFDPAKLHLGGDHLGPLTWQHLSEAEAMANAEELVRQYLLAGFTKIHLDTSMRLADDNPSERLSDETIAKRGAQLCAIAERAFAERKKMHENSLPPVYVIGSEVPIPGGAQEEEEKIMVTNPADCLASYHCFKENFAAKGLEEAWERVLGMVVQPGVEFGDSDVFYYDSLAAKPLMTALAQMPNLAFEGHSTDYQTPACLRNMVADGVAILKVGPALTFGLREALFALEAIEKEGASVAQPSNFRQLLELTMLEQPGYWQKYYHGDEAELAFKRAYSYSDRARYYLPNDQVQQSIERLCNNIDAWENLPEALISQYMPKQYERVCNKEIEKEAKSLILDHIGDWIDDYLFAVLP